MATSTAEERNHGRFSRLMDLMSAQEPGLSRIKEEQCRRRIGEAAAGRRADVRCVQEGLTGHQGRAAIAHRRAQTEDVAGEHARLEDRLRYRGRQLLLRQLVLGGYGG